MGARLLAAMLLGAPGLVLAQGMGPAGYAPPPGLTPASGSALFLDEGDNLSDLDDASTALVNLGTLPAYRVCPTCAYTTIQSAITAADSAGGGVVKVTPGSYTEALTAAAGVHMLCDVPSAQVKACRITGTAGSPAITYDIGTPGGTRENHVSLARGFLLISGGGVAVPAVSVECPVAAAQRVELYEVDMFTASGSGHALRMTCGATGSSGLETVARIHGEMTQLASQGGATEPVVYHSGGWLDVRGYATIDAASGDDVALEVAAAGSGTVSFADFLMTGTVAIGAAATTTVTLGQGIVASATVAPITTNGGGALSLGVVGLWAVAAAPAACIAGAGVVAHAPALLSNVANCGTLIASTVNGGAGPDFAGAVLASRLQQEVLGTAASLDVGTGASNVVQLDGSARLPAVDGSQLTNLPGGANALNDLTDVNASPVLDNTPLVWDTGTSTWVHGTTATVGRVDNNNDITIQPTGAPYGVLLIAGASGDIIARTGGGGSAFVLQNSAGTEILKYLQSTGYLQLGRSGVPIRIGKSTISIDDLIDDDTMATAAADTLATSESIKAYVDAQIAGVGGSSAELVNAYLAATTSASSGTRKVGDTSAAGGTWTEVSDTGADFDAATGTWTAPATGVYSLSYSVSAGAGVGVQGLVYIDGTQTYQLSYQASGRRSTGHVTLSISAGSTVEFYAYTDSSGTIYEDHSTTGRDTFFSIHGPL